MRHGKLHAGLLCLIFVIFVAMMVAFGEAGTNWDGQVPTASPSAVPGHVDAPPAPGYVNAADTTAPKSVVPTTSSAPAMPECAQVQCAQVQCVQTTYVPVRTVRYYNVGCAAPQAEVGCAGRSRIGVFGRLRARRSIFRAGVRGHAAVGCAG